jgi:hypothetical protein
MTEKNKAISNTETKKIKKVKAERNLLTKKIVRLNALACNNHNRQDFDIELAMNKSHDELQVLGAIGGLQEMLAAQMLSVHRLQQLSIAMVIEADYPSIKQYFTNTAIKLANTFVLQANLLTRLQGHESQKVTVEHVHVYPGGQAVVGHINSPAGEIKLKNEK